MREDERLPRRAHSTKWIGAKIGALVGIIAVVAWAAVFALGARSDTSWLWFPISSWILKWIYGPSHSINPLLWYGGAVLQWAAIGGVIDLLVRGIARMTDRDRHGSSSRPSE